MNTSTIFCLGFLQASLLMFLENYIGHTLTIDELKASPQTCLSQDDILNATNNENKIIHSVKDYTVYLIITSVYMAIIAAIFAIFFRTQQKRSDVDNDFLKSSSIEDINGSSERKKMVFIIYISFIILSSVFEQFNSIWSYFSRAYLLFKGRRTEGNHYWLEK